MENAIEKLIFLAQDEMNIFHGDPPVSYMHTAEDKSKFETPILVDSIFQNRNACWMHKYQYTVNIAKEGVRNVVSYDKWEKLTFKTQKVDYNVHPFFTQLILLQCQVKQYQP